MFTDDLRSVAPPRERDGRRRDADGHVDGYASVSTVAGYLAGGGDHLRRWECRELLASVARRPDLVTRAQAVDRSAPALDQLVQEALVRGRDDSPSLLRAPMGTAVHDAVSEGTRPPALAEHRAAYERILAEAGLEVVEAEVHCRDHERRLDGHADALVRTPDGGRCVLDLKTGSRLTRPVVEAQLDGYAGALPVVSRAWAYVAHVPLDRPHLARLHRVPIGHRPMDTALAVYRMHVGQGRSQW